MIVVWGTKIREKPIGHVREFCPLHRAVHEFELAELRSTPHLYGISVWVSKLRQHMVRPSPKSGCSHVAIVEPTMFDHGTAEERNADRLELENAIAANPHAIGQQERGFLLNEALAEISMAREQGLSDRRASEVQRPYVMGSLVPLVALIVLSIATNNGVFALLGLASMLVGFVLAGYTVSSYKRRFRRELTQLAVQSTLTPLRPSATEFEAALAWLKASDHSLPKRMRRDLAAAVDPSTALVHS